MSRLRLHRQVTQAYVRFAACKKTALPRWCRSRRDILSSPLWNAPENGVREDIAVAFLRSTKLAAFLDQCLLDADDEMVARVLDVMDALACLPTPSATLPGASF
ncbi:MAG: hypothetical protein ACPG5U_11630 [Planktomarina sp.]